MKNITEAAIKLDIVGLESDDLAGIARMVALAGDAERDTAVVVEPQPEINPLMQTDIPSEEVISTPVFSPEEIVSTEPVDDNFESDFNVERLGNLAGIHEEINTKNDLDNTIDSHVDLSLSETQLLPDLSLDTIEEDSTMNLHGPFDSEEATILDATKQTNGVEGNNFIILPQDNGYFWKRVVSEQINEPEFTTYDDEGLQNSRHEMNPKKNRIGDNAMCESGNDEVDLNGDGETVADIFESLNSRYEQYISEAK